MNTITWTKKIALTAACLCLSVASYAIPISGGIGIAGTSQELVTGIDFSNVGSPDLKRCESQGGSATFTLFMNGIQKFHKIVVGTDGVHESIKLDLNPEVKTLTLVVDNADGDNTCDAAFWGDARFMVEPPAPAKTANAKAPEPAKAPE